jgi:phage terminase large subunit-like protein
VRNTYAIGGCDLSSVKDLTAATLLIRARGDDTIYVLQHYFLPEARIEELDAKSSKEAPYKKWEERGLMTFCKGEMVQYSDVTAWFEKMREEYQIDIWRCGYDRAMANYWVEEMKYQFGDVMESVAQGAKTWTVPMKEMGAMLAEKKINYNNNPILKWCLTNTAVKTLGSLESIEPVKITRKRRIDGTVSLLNAYVIYVKYRQDYLNMVEG